MAAPFGESPPGRVGVKMLPFTQVGTGWGARGLRGVCAPGQEAESALLLGAAWAQSRDMRPRGTWWWARPR